jgi:hypothetical protein
MKPDEALCILSTSTEGKFADPARLLEKAIRSGAGIFGPRELIPTQDLQPIYELRRKRLQGLQKHIPGYDDVIALFDKHPEARWLLICVDSENGGAMLLSENHMLAGCFAHESGKREGVGP